MRRTAITRGLSYTLRYLAVVLWIGSGLHHRRPGDETALALAREIGDREGAATTLTVRSYVSRSLDDNLVAEGAALESLALHEGMATGAAPARRSGRWAWRSSASAAITMPGPTTHARWQRLQRLATAISSAGA